MTVGIAVGSIVYLFGGRAFVYSKVESLKGLTSAAKNHIDKALLGNSASIDAITKHFPSQIQHQVYAISQNAALTSFSHVMWLNALLALAAAVICSLFMSSPKKV